MESCSLSWPVGQTYCSIAVRVWNARLLGEIVGHRHALEDLQGPSYIGHDSSIEQRRPMDVYTSGVPD